MREKHFDEMSIREINKFFRSIDQSHLWPVRNKFNATERAIRKVRKFRKESMFDYDGPAYAHLIENELGSIVNNEKNW